jgi:phage N-6-adenine-methyltransferase
MADDRNRPDSKFSTDQWLTPPSLLKLLGPFDLDPACADVMPWKAATQMLTKTDNGLETQWPAGARVWLNPPYSDILPWTRKLARHQRLNGGSGLFLVPAKSTDTVWGQYTLNAADAIFFLAGRLLFWYPDGTESTGKWSPSMLCAFGEKEAELLVQLWSTRKLNGVVMKQALLPAGLRWTM